MKKFIVKTLFYFIPFCLLYSMFYFSQELQTGDLGRLGSITFGKEYDTYLKQNYLKDNLITTVTEISDSLKSENNIILTIGDSFSQQEIFGYQNYLGHLINYKIINFIDEKEPFERALTLLNSGYIDTSFCKVLIIESVDRLILHRLMDINGEKDSIHYKKETEEKKQVDSSVPERTELSHNQQKYQTELYKFFSWIRLKSIDRNENPVKKYDLNNDYFEHPSFSDKLFFYYCDLGFQNVKQGDIDHAVANFNLVNKKFADKGIDVIYLIAADKYDVYHPFLKDNSLPLDTTTDTLSRITGITVIDTRFFLQLLVKEEVKDVYMINDTHWSYKSSEQVAQKILAVINERIDSIK